MRRILERIPTIFAIGIVSTGLESCEVGRETAEPAASFSVSVDFGDGEEKWRAASANWNDLRSRYNEVNFHFEAKGQFPLVMGSIIPGGETIFPLSWDENEYLFFEYYSRNWENIGAALWDYELNIPYGDWQVDSGTVTITSLSATHLSGTADLVMYNLVEYAIEINDYPSTKPLKVTFDNVPINMGTRSEAVRGAAESPDRVFSFSAKRGIPGKRR